MVQGHHENWAKPPSDFDSARWMLNHTALVNRERELRERLGYTIQGENQNLFRLRGNAATLADKPDLIAEKDNDVVVIDAKTTRPSPAHRVLVIFYRNAVPRALDQYRGKDVKGHVRYPEANLATPRGAELRVAMSTKKKKNQNQQNQKPPVDQTFPKKTAMAVIVTGALLAFWFAFAPETWWQKALWQTETPTTLAGNHSMIAMVAASLTLSTLILTNNSSDNTYKTLLYVTAGLATWMATFFAVDVKSLIVALWILLCLTPLGITILRPYKPTFTKIMQVHGFSL